MSFFPYRHEAHTTNLELKSDQMNMLSVPNIRTVTYVNKSIKYHCARLWNSFLNKVVPTDDNFDNNIILDNIGNIYLFKSKFKKPFSIFIHFGLTYFLCIESFSLLFWCAIFNHPLLEIVLKILCLF